MVPRPVKAVLLLFPISSALEERKKEEDQKIINEGSLNDKGVVLWIKQTVTYFVFQMSSPNYVFLDLQCMRNHRTSSCSSQCGLLSESINIFSSHLSRQTYLSTPILL